MRIAPLIHSRTFYNDFNANFAVRPRDLDVDWASCKILPSTRDIDLLHGFRRVVAKKGDFCIAGISGYFEDFIKKYLPEIEAEAQQYFRVEDNKKSKGFIGYVFRDDGVPNVTFEDLWQMFNENMQRIWNSRNSETRYVNYTTWQTKNPPAEKPSGSQIIGNIECYEINEDNEEKIFNWCLSQRIDFCSNVDQYKIFKDGKYKVLTAPNNVIKRIQDASPQILTEPTEIAAEPPQENLETLQPPNISVEDILKWIEKIPTQDIPVEDFLKVLKEFSKRFVIIDKKRKNEVTCTNAGYTFFGDYEITIKFNTTPLK